MHLKSLLLLRSFSDNKSSQFSTFWKTKVTVSIAIKAAQPKRKGIIYKLINKNIKYDS